MEYIVDQCYDFKVDTTADVRESFFRLILENGKTIHLPKYKYQIGKDLPPTVHARVKMLRDGEPVLGGMPAEHVYRLYGGRDWMRESYDFTVARLPKSSDGFYELVDENGIFFRLSARENRLSAGQHVRCRFDRITQNYFQISRDKQEDALHYMSFDEIIDSLDLSPVAASFIRRYVSSLPQFSTAMAECAAGRAFWVVSLLDAFRDTVAEMFATARVPRNKNILRAMFSAMREATLCLLEDSEFLRNTTGDRRSDLQQQLTETAECVEPYLQAIDILSQGTCGIYVRGMMEKLRKSGYLYHPKLQFGTIMAIFRIRPKLIKNTLGSIYEAVMQWRLDTWQEEPFRSAFVEQFELYLANARHRLDELTQPESAADFVSIENVLTAIALQLHIADPRSFDGYTVNRSRLYRYASLARPRSADALLDKAFYTLLKGGGKHLEYSYDSIKNYTLMMTALCTPLHEAQMRLDSTRVFNSGHVRVELSADGLSLRRTDDAPDADQVLPNNCLPWLSPKVYLDGVAQLSRAKLNKFSAHQELWKEIELALLEERATPGPGRLHRADEGDEVEIIITGCEPDRFRNEKNPRLTCRIVDENFLPGEGYMYRSDIVDFRISNIDQAAYTAPDGSPLRFQATVIGCDDNDCYRFSMKEQVGYVVRNELANRTDEMLAVITYTDGPMYSAICERGFGLYVKRSEGFENLSTRTYVRVRLTDIPVSGSIVGEIVDYAYDGETVDQACAIRHLLHALGESDAEGAEDMEIVRDADELLSSDELSEIIEMLRFKALAAPQLLTAVDYLGLARVLARVIGQDEMADMLQTHMALLGEHQFYADNTRIDAESLLRLAPAASESPLLERMYTRLRIVSLLGQPDSLAELAAYVDAPRNELEGTLARLVSSYNMLVNSGIDDVDNLKFIKKRIAEILGVNSETHHLKHYGSESQYVEFKSSLVFPARKKGEKRAVADVERQTREILEIIAGFLNSTGGTLFIGVNDQHYEKGLADDFAYLPKHIRTMDNLSVYLDNIVRKSYDQGSTVGNYVHISLDEESERGVLVVQVDASRRPVTLGGSLFVRQSTSTVPMLDDDRRIFIADRERRYDEMMRIGGSMQDTVVENAAQTAYVPPVAAAEDKPMEQSAGQYGQE
ncbi:MAG: ATP-binding protein, partial [Muribaculaceae bacterium]|nr:ATP-binding protein [Muribaculaceae bacterium]